MKRLYTLYIIIGAILASLATACDGFQISDNGDFDGMWHLVEVDTLFYGDKQLKADFTKEGIFWSVQSELICVEDKQNRHLPCLLRFQLSDGRLLIHDPYIYHNRLQADEKLSDPALLAPFGITGLECDFLVEELGKKRMVLVGPSLRLSFVRF